MNNKNKIIVSIVVLFMCSVGTFASFDCVTVDMEELEEVIELYESGEELTDEQQELFDNAEACKPAGGGGQMGGGMGGEMDGERPGMGGEMGDGEMDGERPEMGGKMGSGAIDGEKPQMGNTDGNNDTSSLKSAYKTQIQAAFGIIYKKMSSYTDEEKVEMLTTISEKIDSKIELIENSDYSETQKETCYSILEYLLEQIEDKIEELEE